MSIKLRNIVIDYGESIAVNDISLSIETGELVSLLGPSGCGKTTTLNAIAGLVQTSQGQIIFDGVDVTQRSPQKRNIGLVFQNYALYPHLSVFQNIAFPLYENKKFKQEIIRHNKLIKLQMQNLKFFGSSTKTSKFQEEISKNILKLLNDIEDKFDKLQQVKLKEIQKISDTNAISVYGTKELNAYRSRLFTIWFDQARAFVETQKYNLFNSFFESLNANIGSVKATLADWDKAFNLDLVISQTQKYVEIESLEISKSKIKSINESVKSNKTLLESEIKSIIKFWKLHGKPLQWLVDDQTKTSIFQKQENEFNDWTRQFQEAVVALMENNQKEQKALEKMWAKILESIALIEDQKVEIAEKHKELYEQKKHFRQEVKSAVLEVAEKVEIVNQLHKKPYELSGGQQQRVSIARAIVKKPKVLLLDEPLSNLDAKLRSSTREWIKKFQKSTGITTIFVTHDQEEAMSISDKIFVMSKGQLQQSGKPMEIYKKPENVFVANFIGTPSMNFIEKTKVDKLGNVTFGGVSFGQIQNKTYFNKEVIMGIRPEHFELANSKTKIEKANSKVLQATIDNIEKLGRSEYIKAVLKFNNQEIRVIYDVKNISSTNNQDIELNAIKGNIYIFDIEDEGKLVEVI
ncbi:sn-glycerol-3-phosphate ABC transporter ATP-binding protein [Williamsoniiplasma luminosum]|uniref:sn-glycerol-3-phosphate ABC transporter ATP-binding protein n=1 Tax=Williamsoniiplasma luminosum TaxID=214888 RepID=A0A2K8NTP0_9MOLU|nr:ATP-binding cassette domain-containing protein [Williamsoniiplasma luminosum]ATZ16926.1 sn-glycerol-3-phosphate ABC transporter ATP-binding protein [Williamsoniiplasma luminosum]